MRVVEVDERDSSWEDSAARFRLYLFEGPGNAVTTLDFLDAQIHDVIEAANLAGSDGKLWSIALVVDAAADGRRVIRVFPDHGHRWPLWESFADAYCGLSQSLSDDLRLWYDEWERRGIDWRPDGLWVREGYRLVGLLRAEVGDVAEIRPEFDRPV